MAAKLALNLQNKTPSDNSSERVKDAVKRKKASTETVDEAWERILAMKNSDTDNERLLEVKNAMTVGTIGRSPANSGKRFSKAEALRLWRELQERQRESKLAELVANTPDNYVLANTPDLLRRLIAEINDSDVIALDCETFGDENGALDQWRGEMAGFSISTRQRHYYVPLKHVEGDNIPKIPNGLITALNSSKIVMHNAPFDCKWFYVAYGIDLINALHADTRIMAMAFDENRSHRLKDLITDWLQEPSDNFDQLFGKTPFNEIPLDVALVYAAGDTEKTLKLYDWMTEFYDKREDLQRIKRLVFDIEMPVCREFIRADLRGIKFNTDEARKLDAKLENEETMLQHEIYSLLREEINLNSPTQLKQKLFVDLRLPDVDKGSTGVKTLKRLKGKHPVIEKLLEYREVGKLRQAFTSKLPNEVKSDGRIHPSHNTYGAATGRFTCNTPNTQQIPAKRPEVRHLFRANGDDRILISIDYSQIELRVLAHMANETELIKAFLEGRDIHSTTAAMISDGRFTYEQIEAEKDTDGSPEQKFRKQAKVVNFGIVYGMSAKGLAATLEITQAEAQLIIDNYFKGYAGIKTYMDEQKRLARKQGYVTDLYGRKRRLKTDYKSKDQFQHYRADRMAGNFPIQASAGSILKKAIVDLQRVLPELDSYILLQVHDELVFDCPRNISEENVSLIRETMENTVKLVVPIRCDVEIQPLKWAEKVHNEEWFNATS